jgi:hypothetical protein
MIELEDEYFENMMSPGNYDEVPDEIEYRMPNQYELLPFVRCPGCGGVINKQSIIARQMLDKAQAERFDLSNRGMSVEEYNIAVNDVIKSSGLTKSCCTMNIIEQMIIPKRPTYIERYIQGEGEKTGNVKIVRINENLRKSYNPYSFEIRELTSGIDIPPESDTDTDVDTDETSDGDTEDLSESSMAEDIIPKKRVLGPYKVKEALNKDIYPSMPEIDETFQEESYFKKSSKIQSRGMVVAGFLRTGVPGYESPLIKGTLVGTR